MLGIPNARFWADSQGEALAHEVQQALEREKAAAGKTESSARDLLSGLTQRRYGPS